MTTIALIFIGQCAFALILADSLGKETKKYFPDEVC